jgi:hypothetical protein
MGWAFCSKYLHASKFSWIGPPSVLNFTHRYFLFTSRLCLQSPQNFPAGPVPAKCAMPGVVFRTNLLKSGLGSVRCGANRYFIVFSRRIGGGLKSPAR